MQPLADGGEGSLQILKSILNLISIKVKTVDPLGRNIEAEYFHLDDTVFIELANASGLRLLDEHERSPLITSTRGTGLMMKDALIRGFKKIYLFVGGSASNDAGIGIAQALGFDFLSENGDQLDPIGSNLIEIKEVKDNGRFDFEDVQIKVFCDVTNPMHGFNGASYVYAQQKGGNESDIKLLDNGLKNYDNVLKGQFQKHVCNIQGIGAAGAVGASLVGLMRAKLENGFKMLAELTQLEDAIRAADYVVTGEGKIDHTSFQGKVVGNVLELCKKNNTPCIGVSGIIDSEDKSSALLFTKSIISIADNLQDAMESAEKYLFEIGAEIGVEIIGIH